MKNILLSIAVAATLLVGSLATPATAEAKPVWRGGYYGGYGGAYYGYRPYYGGYYGYRPYYGGYYSYRPYYSNPGYYYGPRYYGPGYYNSYPGYRYGARVGAVPGVGTGVYVY